MTETPQVGLVNTIRLVIKDVYGNLFTTDNDVVFYLELTPDGESTQVLVSSYNGISNSYEFNFTPTKAVSTVFKIYETLTLQEIGDSPLTKDVLAGGYNVNEFILTENHDNGICYIALTCNLKLTMYDSYDNQIMIDGLIDISDFDSFLIGPTDQPLSQATYLLTSIKAIGDGSGEYDLEFSVLTSGYYEIYTRIGPLQIKTYPLIILAVSNQVSAANSVILETPLSPSIAGEVLTLNLKVYDLYNNLAVEENIPIIANMSLDSKGIVLEGTVTKVSTGVYTITFIPYIRGDYSVKILVFDLTETYQYIQDMPQTQTILPSDISIDNTVYEGSSLNGGRFGFVETFDLIIKDEYDNNYNQETIYYNNVDNPVYQIEFMADDVDPKTVLLVSSDPDQGYYEIGYRIINAYSYLYIRIWLFVTDDDGLTYSYQPVNDFPIIVPIEFSPDDLLDEYTNLYQGGIGMTERTTVAVISNLTAGTDLAAFMEIYPKNAYDFEYIHSQERQYLILSYAQGGSCFSAIHNYDEILALDDADLMTRHCRQFSYDQDPCDRYGLCNWIPTSTQTKNYNEGDCSPKE